MPVTIAQLLNDAKHHVSDIDARLLLQHALQVSSVFLATYSDEIVNVQKITCFYSLLERRINGEPIAYIIGQREFYDLTFHVTPAVLIPRPETETLVELALASIPMDRSYIVLDLGTGSGAIALTLAKHRPLAQVMAIDLSAEALEVAQMNATLLEVDNVHFTLGDWFQGVAGQYNLIVSNPPYVAIGDPHLDQGDLRFEPQIALSAPDDGIACIRTIIAQAPQFLCAGGQLLLEHGYNQAAQCRQLLAQEASFINIFSYPDLAGILRVTGGQRI